MPDTRKYWIDYLRIFAMLSVVSVHMSNIFYTQFGKINPGDWWAANIVEGVLKGNVCLFAMIAGAILLNKEYDLKDFYKKRAVRLLVPFFFWTVFYLLVRVSRGESFIEIVKYDLLMLGTVTPHLWFFSMYIGLMLFVPFINMFIIGRRPGQTELRTLLIFILAFFLFNQGNAWIHGLKPYGIEWYSVFPWFIGYLLAGYYIDRYAAQSHHSNRTVILVFIGLSAAGVLLNYIACRHLNLVDDSFVLNKTGILIFLRCLCVYYFFRKNFDLLKGPKWVVALSNASFGVYLIHPYIADLVKGAFHSYFEQGAVYLIFLIPVVSALSFAVIWAVRRLPVCKYIM